MWKQITDYDYEVSDKGEVRRIGSSTVKKPTLDKTTGYLVVSLWRNNVGSVKLVHRLVAIAFVEGDPSLTVNHIDGNKQNNLPSNLEWITKADNTRHQHQTGLANSIRQFKPTKIQPECYESITDRFLEGETCAFIALDFDCSEGAVAWVTRKTLSKR